MPLDDEVTRADFERAFRQINDLNRQSAETMRRIEAMTITVLRAMLDAGEIERASFERNLAEPRPAPPPDEKLLAVEIGSPAVDKYTLTSPPDLDCAALFPICGARCCVLTFPLTPQDLAGGQVAWSYRRPYHIAHGADHRCVHQDRATGGCTVYEERPGICRTYDCRKDPRVWIDFEKRILAPLEAVMPGDPLKKER